MGLPHGALRAHRSLILACAGVLACASQKTREELAEDRSVEAERLMVAATEAMDQLDVERAETNLKKARAALSDPAARAWPDHSFQKQELQDKEDRLVSVKEEVERNRLEEAVKAQTEKVDELVQRLDVALEPLRGKDGAGYTKSQIDQATEVRSDLMERLNEGVDLETRSEPYQAYAQTVAQRLKTVPEVIAVASRAVAFNDGPIAASQRARELSDEAKQEEDLAEKVTKLISAKGELDRCATGASEVAKEPALAKVKFEDGGKPITPKALVQSCQKRSKALKTEIARLQKKAKKKPPAVAKAKGKKKKKK